MAGNVSGNAYALTVLSPIKAGNGEREIAHADLIRDRLEGWNAEANSPMALVPQTYLCRFFVLDDVYTESLPGADLRNVFADLKTMFSDDARRDAMPFSLDLRQSTKRSGSAATSCRISLRNSPAPATSCCFPTASPICQSLRISLI